MWDAVVVGVGAMGSAALDHLARRGHRVLGLEQFTLAHALGSSHGGSRMIHQSYFEHPDYVPVLRRAYELWDDLDAWQRGHGGNGLFFRTGGVSFGPASSAIITGSLLAARDHGLPYSTLSLADARRRFPQFSPADTDTVFHDDTAGFVIPEETITAQVARAQEHGAEVWENTEVVSITPTAGGVTVDVSRDGRSTTVTARKAVVTAGAWTPRLLGQLNVPLTVERQLMYWLRPAVFEAEFRDGPVFIHDNGTGEHIYGFPWLEGEVPGVKVAAHHNGLPTSPDTLDRTVSPAEVAALRARLALISPALADAEFIDAKACMYTSTPDKNFVIGRDPRAGHENVVLACGFSGHGFKFAPAVGELLADLVESGSLSTGVPMFDPLRFPGVQVAAGR
ncbi:N-methyl-L-tryptophan oxidase [Corynebacterium guangdongense]|uniref:Sarcosine oxidase n=1 Tax=Corynebacterium guangdongense TaxID=1783348 RepID=A0ABU1ZU75_9CORY|nr:N-methyl-L-tryptophan oxidase [Corynebacterium guangdongense]MDR7328484.1 sarcosine oxidase [Corynebacterium guangdongense]WJZ17061.1 Monomeric sarcosine oxidase [Corynebacterium guangdongense]